MNIDGAIYQDCKRIVRQEMRRLSNKCVVISDEEDLRQELTFAALRGAERSDGRPDRGYVRASVRNAITRLYAHVDASKRRPADLFNRPIPFAKPNVIDISVNERMPDPEALAMAREQVDQLIASLPQTEAALVRRVADGEIELTRRQAKHIRYSRTGGGRMSDKYAIPADNRDGKALPPCHVRGEKPEGYAADEKECHSCMDKFSCLPEAIAQPSVWTDRGAATWTVDDDHEVAALLALEMTFEEVKYRVDRRVDLSDAGDLIPPDLLVRKVSDVVNPASPVEAIGEPVSPADPEPPAQEDEVAKKKKATKKKAPKRPAKKKAAKKKAATKKKAPARPRRPTVAGTTSASKSLPRPTTITEEKMVSMLERVKLKRKVVWEWGMQIVRKKRGEEGEHVVTITRNGFLYNDQHYSSLSAVAQNASGTFCRSGNDWFAMHHRGTEVRSAKGKVIASRTVGS